MKIGITGATGLLGQAAATAFRAAEGEVIGYSRNGSSSLRSYHPDEPEKDQWDDLDALVHLAGKPIAARWSSSRKKLIRSSRIDATRRLVEALAKKEKRPSILICASAIGYYGEAGGRELSEASPAGEGFLADVCQEWEAAAREATELGIRVICPRFGMVLSREGGALKAMEPLFSKGLGGKAGSGKQWISWIHEQDAARLLVHCLSDARAEGPINAVAPAPVTNADFSKALGKALGKPAMLPAPSLALKLALGGMSELILGSQKVLPAKAKTLGFEWNYPTLEVALEHLYAE